MMIVVEPEREPERPEDVDDGRLERKPGDDPGEGDREDHGERDDFAAEEAIARYCHRGERPEDERDHGRAECGQNRVRQRVPHVGVVERDREPPGAVLLDRPGLRDVLVERVEGDDEERQVDEGERHERAAAQQNPRESRLDHQSDSKAPSLRATSRYATTTTMGTSENAAAVGSASPRIE